MSEQPVPTPHEAPWAAPEPGAPAGVPAALRPRRRRGLAVGIAIAAVAAAVLLGGLVRDDLGAHRQASRESARAGDLARALDAAGERERSLRSEASGLRADNARLAQEARSPTLSMWNSCGGPCAIGPGSVRVGSVPDTFELRVNFTSDVPVRTYFLTFHQWTQFDNCGFDVRCVSGPYRSFGAATSLDQRFSDAEGCSGYVWVLQADRQGTIDPDVSVRYLPASGPTGVCAGSP